MEGCEGRHLPCAEEGLRAWGQCTLLAGGLHCTITEHFSVLLLTSDSIQHIYISHYMSVTVLSGLLNLLI